MESFQTSGLGAPNISYGEIPHDTAQEAKQSGGVRALYLFSEHSIETIAPQQRDQLAGRVILMAAIKMAAEKYQLGATEGNPMAVKEAIQHANVSVAQNTSEFQEKLKQSAAKAFKGLQLFQQSQKTYEAAQQGSQLPNLPKQNTVQPNQNTFSSQSQEVGISSTPNVTNTNEKTQSKAEERNAKQQQQDSIDLAKQKDRIVETQQDQEKKRVLEEKQKANAIAQQNPSKEAAAAV